MFSKLPSLCIKPKVLLIVLKGAAVTFFDGITLHTLLQIPVGQFGSNVPNLSD